MTRPWSEMALSLNATVLWLPTKALKLIQNWWLIIMIQIRSCFEHKMNKDEMIQKIKVMNSIWSVLINTRVLIRETTTIFTLKTTNQGISNPIASSQDLCNTLAKSTPWIFFLTKRLKWINMKQIQDFRSMIHPSTTKLKVLFQNKGIKECSKIG